MGFFLKLRHLYRNRTYSNVAMAEPLPKKPRRSLLPDLESMAAQRSSDKQAIGVVKTE